MVCNLNEINKNNTFTFETQTNVLNFEINSIHKKFDCNIYKKLELTDTIIRYDSNHPHTDKNLHI